MPSGPLLVGGDVALLVDVLRSALAAPSGEPVAGRLAAEALIALAAGDHESIVVAVLGDDDGFEVRSSGSDALSFAAVSGLSATEGVRCFAGAASGEEAATAELVTRRADGDERVVLSRRGSEPPVLSVDEAALQRLASLRAAPPSTRDAPVAELAEVLAHMPTRQDIAEAVASALAETTVEVDLGALAPAPAEPAPVAEEPPDAWVAAIADAVVGRLVGERRAPRAHDVADLLATLVPTADEVAALTAARLGRQVADVERTVGARLAAIEATLGPLAHQLAEVRAAIIG